MKQQLVSFLHALAGTELLRDAWRGSWSERILWFALVCLPFQQALTFELGFPLKASEILAVAGIVVGVFESRRGYFLHPASALVALLAGIVIVSSAWNLFAGPKEATHDGFPLGLEIDLVLYTGYAGLALCLF